MTDTLLVFMDVAGEMLRVGTAFFTRRRQSLSTTFTYEPGYLADRRSFAIDPALVLAGGSHHVEELPGAFQDCAPDRWGRNLIAKRIRAEARQANRTPPSISDIDYLVGVSALTLVGGRDGSGLDYADVALHLEESSARAEADLADLFRRAVLSVAIRNTDDHLRNLGLLYASGGWRLSPAFDVNPNPDPAAPRQTTIGGAELPEDEPAGLMALAPLCHLSNERAHQLIKGVLDATTDWRTVAASNDLPASEIAQFEQSFDQQRHLLSTLLKPSN